MACAEGTRTVERPLAALEAALTKLKAADAAASNERCAPPRCLPAIYGACLCSAE